VPDPCSTVTARNNQLLIVEDNDDIREVEAAILDAAGYDVRVATNGAEALAILRGGFRPALIVLDATMPVMDGFEFCLARQHDVAIRGIPVLLISALAPDDPRIVAACPSAFLGKPFEPDALVALVARLCGERASGERVVVPAEAPRETRDSVA
jgi:CheY-like chemotaxis protein